MSLLPLIGTAVSALGSFFGQEESNKDALRLQQTAFRQNQSALLAAEKRALADRPNLWSREDTVWARENQASIDAANLAYSRSLEAEQRAAQRDATKVQTLVNDARAAGIHPLVALGVSYGGPLAQIVQGSTPSHSPASGSIDRQAAQMGVPTNGNAIGDAAAQIGIGLAQMQNMRLTEAQIENVKASTANILSEAQSRTMIASARLNGQSLFAGDRIKHNPNTDDAQKAANRYGEPGDWLFGMYNLFADTDPMFKSPMGQMGQDFGKWLRSWL